MLYSPHPVRQARPLPHAQSGFTIVELSVAVAIAGVLLVSAIALVQVVLRQARANDVVSGIPRLMAQIDKIYTRANNYVGLGTDVAVGFGAFDGVFDIAGTAPNRIANNRFGYTTSVDVATVFSGPATNTGYVVTFAGIPAASCADIVSSAAATGVRGILVQPEATVGVRSITAAGVGTLALAGMQGVPRGGAAPAANTGGAAVVQGNLANGALDVAAMTDNRACGTGNSTVSIGLVNWK
ncbi:prepilin-type N-terminal cleavage/methylation domain-containing protein [Herbaspirillum sp. AP02]|uniref:type II secretion system protein n=1 Tax=unclassified Herbaspirillum TaxID=2624150 RepID=UPI0015D9B073|nr:MULTISPECIES: type 4 pilus major pilin [unclassified Herbaspirillum]MBG7617936.1 prepilin-type N-terminal cleavage/methylation domain-containing protein [Herbaspirillum sp. AP02]NZD70122.1 prepilin-type N-terminal cleavage/methylation domain-containing protein [Herbaspirillum sp. AP21]